jgi:hypothetical protein
MLRESRVYQNSGLLEGWNYAVRTREWPFRASIQSSPSACVTGPYSERRTTKAAPESSRLDAIRAMDILN